MKYSPKYFKDNLPKWKWKKDPLISKILYRPISFFTASLCANLNISANAVSYFSALIAVIASGCFLFNNHNIAIAGAVLINIWLILDCTDGNLARSVKAQPMGEFADSLSSYILVAFMFNSMGYYVYLNGGILVSKNNALILVSGAFASTFDTLSRLIFQKFQSIRKDYYESKGITKDDGISNSIVNKIRLRLDAEIGLGGILPLVTLLCTIFNFMDVVIILWCAYYGVLFVSSVCYHIVKAVMITKKEE